MIKILETILRDGFMLVLTQDKLDPVRTAEALMKAGLNNMEITCRLKEPFAKIKAVKQQFPDFACGVASLVDAPDFIKFYNKRTSGTRLPFVEQAVESGADYIVSAMNFRDETYRRFAGDIVMIPGCATVTEIVFQFAKGANFCKFFPATQLGGAEYVKAIDSAIHREISIIPIGGVRIDNIPYYVKEGVLVVSASIKCIDKPVLDKILHDQDYALLTEEAKKIKDAVDAARKDKYPSIDFKTVTIDKIRTVTGRDFNLER